MLHMSVHTCILKVSKLTVAAWRAGSAAFGLVTAQSPGVLAGCCCKRELSGLNLGTLLWRERLRETLRTLSPPLPPDLTSLACLPAPVYIDYYYHC
jgi:hypothetical protein